MSFTAIKSAVETGLARFVEQNPYLWKAGWEIVKRVPVLLPHDKSYNAFRHFVKAIPQGLFLDVGANDGITALGFRKFSTSYRILSLEPNPLLAPGLLKIKSRDPLFDYRLLGAGSKPGSVRLYMPVYRGIALHTYTSGNLDKSKATLRHICGNSVAETAEIREFSVDIVTVDSLGVKPSIVKIDVEGFDYEVLLGAVETIERNRPFIAVELAWARPPVVEAFFNERDYAILSYDVGRDRFGPDNSAGQSQGERNSFAVPRERLASLPLSH
jgi:FkbM family methyltransferase